MAEVSVIVPVYNAEKWLARCIRSLTEQTFADIEILLVDDGATDGSPGICDRSAAADGRIRVIHKKNAGVSAARNDGLRAAEGEYVIFCDADDWMEPDAIEVLRRAAKETDADIAVGDIYTVRKNEKIYNRFFAHPFTFRMREEMDGLVRADLFQAYCPDPPRTPTIGYGGPWNKLVRRSFLLENDIFFAENLRGIFDDIFYTANIYEKAGAVVYVQVPVYDYVMNTSSITRSYRPDTLAVNREIFRTFGKFVKTYAPDGGWDSAFAAMIIRRAEEAMRLYFFNTNHKASGAEVRRELRGMMREKPYRWALRHVEMRVLTSSQKELACLMRMGSPEGICLLYQLKILLKKI